MRFFIGLKNALLIEFTLAALIYLGWAAWIS